MNEPHAHEIATHIETTLSDAGFKAWRPQGASDTVYIKGMPVVQVHVFVDGDVNVSWRNQSHGIIRRGRERRRSVIDALRGKMPEGARVI